MRLHEHEGKTLLRAAGIDVPTGVVIADADAAVQAAHKLGLPVVLKAQVLAGGRGHAGGVEVVHDDGKVGGAAAAMLQRDCRGLQPAELLVEQYVDILTELYAAVTIDPEHGRPVMLLGHGGVDIESRACGAGKPLRYVIDPLTGPDAGEVDDLVHALGARPAEQIRDILLQLWDVFTEQQALTVEIYFLETGGGISRDLMRGAMKRVLACPGVRGVLINVYGGINPIHEGALGVADLMADGVEVPVVAKALGNHQEETWEILEAAGVTVVRDVGTETAVDTLLQQMQQVP